MGEVCVDACFLLKLVLPEADSDLVQERWRSWIVQGVMRVAPRMWEYEANSVLRRYVARGMLSESRGWDAWKALRTKGIRTVHPPRLFERAWQLAVQFNRPTTYDTVYLALAEMRGCELWTADQRLVNAVAGRLPWLRSISS